MKIKNEYEEFEDLGEVESVHLLKGKKTKGVTPMFILKNGDKYIANYTPTGSCWLLTWSIKR